MILTRERTWNHVEDFEVRSSALLPELESEEDSKYILNFDSELITVLDSHFTRLKFDLDIDRIIENLF